VRDELFAQLRDLETLARDIRQLLQAEPGAIEQAKGEEVLRVAAALLAARDANAALAPFQRALHLESLRRAAERAATVGAGAQADLDRALGVSPPAVATAEPEWPRVAADVPLPHERDEGGDDGPSPEGGAGVPAVPSPRVPVLAGGAARTFEEATAPPRNP
jgi:hypothetical protein